MIVRSSRGDGQKRTGRRRGVLHSDAMVNDGRDDDGGEGRKGGRKEGRRERRQGKEQEKGPKGGMAHGRRRNRNLATIVNFS